MLEDKIEEIYQIDLQNESKGNLMTAKQAPCELLELQQRHAGLTCFRKEQTYWTNFLISFE